MEMSHELHINKKCNKLVFSNSVMYFPMFENIFGIVYIAQNEIQSEGHCLLNLTSKYKKGDLRMRI